MENIQSAISWWLNVGRDVPDGDWALSSAFTSPWHYMYIVLIIGLTLFGYFFFRNKSKKAQELVIKILCISVISSYALDFLLQPYIGGGTFELCIDKLPFHFCTFMGVLAPFVTFNKKCSFARGAVVAVAMTSSLMYITYPGTAVNYAFYSYTVRQTMFYHGGLFAWAVLNVGFGFTDLDLKTSWKAEILFVINMLWASFGHLLFNNSEHSWNWCFIAHDSFGVGLPDLAMPPIVFVAVSLVCWMLIGITMLVRKIQRNHIVENAKN